MSGADFRNAAPLAIRDSVERFGSWLYGGSSFWPLPGTEAGSEAQRLAFGVGLLVPPFGDEGPEVAAAYPTADATSRAMLAPALGRGDSWSQAIGSVYAADRSGNQWARLSALSVPADIAAMQADGFHGLGGFEGVEEFEFQDAHGDYFGAVYWFQVLRSKVLAGLRQLEALGRAALTETEPQGVRAMRDAAASSGRPLTLEDARQIFARSFGLSETEAATLRRTKPAMALPRTADQLTRSIAALRGIPAAQALAGQDAPTTRSATVPTIDFPIAKVAAGGVGGAVVGGILGKLITGSWTGAAVAGGVGAVAGGGVGYALGT